MTKPVSCRSYFGLVCFVVAAGLSTAAYANKDLRKIGTADDLLPVISACTQSLRSGDNPPLADGWKERLRMSGSPRGVQALKSGDMDTMLASNGNNRELFEVDSKPGQLTLYYSKMNYVACEANIVVETTNVGALKAEIVNRLALGVASKPNKNVKYIKFQYLLDDVEEAYRKDGFSLIFHVASADGKSVFSVLQIKD